MAAEFNIEARWPELFVHLDEQQRRAVVDTLASSWYEGWVPNREDVENLTDFSRGVIDGDEYGRRVRGAAERRHHAGAAPTSAASEAEAGRDRPELH